MVPSLRYIHYFWLYYFWFSRYIGANLCADKPAKPTLVTAPCNALAVRAPCITALPCSPWCLTGLNELLIQQRCVGAVYIAYAYTQPTLAIC
ncbi:unannotated protein [freshwater metagenome]|uniref:Unannotated protein n=1 Tax=freshwater metagenome TaxID=449393 RepID=A0A6J7Q5A1_9ZZZZ